MAQLLSVFGVVRIGVILRVEEIMVRYFYFTGFGVYTKQARCQIFTVD